MKTTKKLIMIGLLLLSTIFYLSAQEDYNIDFSIAKIWNEADTKLNLKYNSISFLRSKSGISLVFDGNFNAEDYNSLEFTNRATAISFTVTILYANGEKTKAFVEDGITMMSIPLKDGAKKAISQIDIQDGEVAGSLRFYTFCFRTAPGTSFIYASDEPVIDEGKPVAFDNKISAVDFVKEMKVGINIGNTFDAIGDWSKPMGIKSETYWGNPKITKELILAYKNAGYDTIRLPVTWANHLIDDNYTIDPLWMVRVKMVVNWIIEEDMYVILNEHHSVRDNMAVPLRKGEGYRTGSPDEEESIKFLDAIWTQIAVAFNNSYDQRLIFETMNEPRNTAHNHCWNPNQASGNCEECRKDFELCNKYNQTCINAIRKSGGNNANRFVMVPSLCTDSGALLNKLFELPKDTAKDKLIVTFHDYIMGSGPKYAQIYFNHSMEIKLDDLFTKMYNKFVANGVPVIMGETGAVINNTPLTERIRWIDFCVSHAKEKEILTILWDDGGDFRCFDRAAAAVCEPEFVKTMVEAASK